MTVYINDVMKQFPYAESTLLPAHSNYISNIMPAGCSFFPIDSYSQDDLSFRIQGVFYSTDNENVYNEMPLEVLQKATKYSIINNKTFLVWTVWFEETKF